MSRLVLPFILVSNFGKPDEVHIHGLAEYLLLLQPCNSVSPKVGGSDASETEFPELVDVDELGLDVSVSRRQEYHRSRITYLEQCRDAEARNVVSKCR